MRLFLILITVSPILVTTTSGQVTKDTAAAAYTRTINSRADKIVVGLSIKDSLKALRVRDIIAAQYRNLNTIHTLRNQQVKTAKEQLASDKALADQKVKLYRDEATASMNKLHTKYIKDLSKELTTDQVDQVKDGMTYGVVPITYKDYQSMLPDLTKPQKAQIWAWLVEAREYAMDAESLEKKHGWFGKYKGRINNYLSAQGYDLKKASKDWANGVAFEKTRQLKINA